MTHQVGQTIRLDALHQPAVLIEGLTGQPRIAFGPKIAASQIAGLGDGAGKKPAAQRAAQHKSDSQFANREQNFRLHVPLPKRILRLQGGNRVHLVRATDGCRGRFR
jgi:hypothetical protein